MTKAFAELYYDKVNMLDTSANIEENFLVFDSSETKFLRHIIIPGVNAENHMEAKAFADEVVKNLDAKFHSKLLRQPLLMKWSRIWMPSFTQNY